MYIFFLWLHSSKRGKTRGFQFISLPLVTSVCVGGGISSPQYHFCKHSHMFCSLEVFLTQPFWVFMEASLLIKLLAVSDQLTQSSAPLPPQRLEEQNFQSCSHRLVHSSGNQPCGHQELLAISHLISLLRVITLEIERFQEL